MIIVIAFYLLTNLAVVASLDQVTLESSQSPLMDATRALFPGAEVLVLLVGVGALLSILGADESGTLGTSRLAYAMALDGLLPHQLTKKHPRFDTPYVAIMVMGGAAFLVSLVGGLAALISSAVLLLSFVYLLTCVSGLVLLRRTPQVRARIKGAVVVPVIGAAICIMLMLLIQPTTWVIGLALRAVGIAVYMFFSPRKELKDLRERFYSREYQMAMRRRQSRRFLALLVHLAHHLYQRARRW